MSVFDAENYWPSIPDGIYEAQFIKFETSKSFGIQNKLYLRFRITDGEYSGEELFMPFNMPEGGKKLTLGYKYYKTWMFVNGNPPSRNTKLHPKIFSNKIFKIKTRSVRPKDHDEKMADNFKYSVVDGIVEVLAG